MRIKNEKQMAKARKPRMAWNSSAELFGTSRDTTSKVTAKANTASVKASRRLISVPRCLKA